MNSECSHIADQLRRAFYGEAWHGPSLTEILAGVTPEQANTRAIADAHTIWELLHHIETWAAQPLATVTRGAPMIDLGVLPMEIDWPPVKETSATAWEAAKTHAFQTADDLARAIETFSDERLRETVPGRDHPFYVLLHGVVQHTLYHAGQIALLKRAVVRI